MSNFDKLTVDLGNDRTVVMGPETIIGTGEVHLITPHNPVLSNVQARELAAALIEAADYATAVKREVTDPVPWPPHVTPDADFPPGSVHAYTWTDPAWRRAVGEAR